MSKRSLRLSTARRERRFARQAAAQDQNQPTTISAAAPETESTEPEAEPIESTISEAKLAANRANSRLSTGAKSPATRAICALNHTIHGLARHRNGVFKLLTSEDPAIFESFKQSLLDEHQPTTETEAQLVNGMAESRWLADRAQNLIDDTCIDPNTGAITDEKKFSVYLRYQTTHTRAFHKCLNDLLKLRSEKRKTELGFEAQKVANEKHAMKKAAHHFDVFRKEMAAWFELGAHTDQYLKSSRENPGFEAQFDAFAEQFDLGRINKEAATQAA